MTYISISLSFFKCFNFFNENQVFNFFCTQEGEFAPPTAFPSDSVIADVMFTLKLLFPGKMLSGEEDGLEDDAERTEVTTGSFTGEMHLPRGTLKRN